LLKYLKMVDIYNDSVFQSNSSISLNIDVIRLSNKLKEVMAWVADQELKAVQDERFEDACKWRDFPEHGIVTMDSLDMKVFYII
jgi:hypothetical protein